jgi:hypothetical protein
MTNCVGTARTPDEQRLVDDASILAAGVLRLRDRQSLPVAKQARGPHCPERLISCYHCHRRIVTESFRQPNRTPHLRLL